jgi:hypothetical protein
MYILEILKTFYSIRIETYKIKLVLYMYYSLKDVTFCFGSENMVPYYIGEKRKITQRRNIKGVFEIFDTSTSYIINFTVFIKDLFALEPGGLKQIILSAGLEDGTKNLLDDYKTCMDKAIVERPFDFLSYSLYDVDVFF